MITLLFEVNMEYLYSRFHGYGHLPLSSKNNSLKWQTALKAYLTPVCVRYSVQYLFLE